MKLTPSMGIISFPAHMLFSIKNMLFGFSGVYALYSPLSGEYYIGSSINLWRRLLCYGHASWLNKYYHLPIGKAIAEYGFSNMIIIVLSYTAPGAQIESEQSFIDLYKPVYNVLKVAGSSRGYVHTDATKERMRQAKLGKSFKKSTSTNINSDKIGVGTGIDMTNETKANSNTKTKTKLSASMRGKISTHTRTIRSVLEDL
jgi:group I intron endonuclease